MSTDNTGVDTRTPEIDEVVPRRSESREARASRISTAVLIGVVGLLLAWLTTKTSGTARFALSSVFDEVQLPTIEVPGVATVATAAVLTLLAAAAFMSGRVHGHKTAFVATVAGLAVLMGFLTWAASGRELPFPVANQFAGTIDFATPLILGALCGVMSERSGVVNVAIEGQMLTAAFMAAIVGSITQSITIALIAAVLGAMLMGALLALFSIKYFVEQVVIGVVINMFASGLTGFIYDQAIQPKSLELNQPPIMTRIAIPGLSEIPFFGVVFFRQTALTYMAGASVVLVWFLLFRTKWGLRIRAVGEHPMAADTVGVNVAAIRWSAVLTGSIFAGLGGSFFTVGFAGSFNKDITVGYGFIALAAVIMGRWRPVLAALMALFFGFVTQMASQLQTINTPMPSQFLLILPYIATIIAVAGLVGRVRPPAADGVPYIKEGH